MQPKHLPTDVNRLLCDLTACEVTPTTSPGCCDATAAAMPEEKVHVRVASQAARSQSKRLTLVGKWSAKAFKHTLSTQGMNFV